MAVLTQVQILPWASSTSESMENCLIPIIKFSSILRKFPRIKSILRWSQWLKRDPNDGQSIDVDPILSCRQVCFRAATVPNHCIKSKVQIRGENTKLKSIFPRENTKLKAMYEL